MNESEIISALSLIFSRPDALAAGVIIGIGDDGAVIATQRSGKSAMVVATDMAVEGIHFDRKWSSLYEVGRKIAAANLADIYAMGAVPEYLLVASAIPKESGDEILSLAQGIADECDLVGARVIGGDLSQGASITVAITALGKVEKPITRSGATAGDGLYLTNLPGWSAAGLYLLKSGSRSQNPFADKAIAQHKVPKIEYARAQEIARYASSACDVSDGLLSEATHIARASKVTVNIERSLLTPIPGFAELESLAHEQLSDIWDWVLRGGEDHTFLFTSNQIKEKDMEGSCYRIGTVKEFDGIFLALDGAPISSEELGYHHF